MNPFAVAAIAAWLCVTWGFAYAAGTEATAGNDSTTNLVLTLAALASPALLWPLKKLKAYAQGKFVAKLWNIALRTAWKKIKAEGDKAQAAARARAMIQTDKATAVQVFNQAWDDLQAKREKAIFDSLMLEGPPKKE